jgi:hypothetical protein
MATEVRVHTYTRRKANYEAISSGDRHARDQDIQTRHPSGWLP